MANENLAAIDLGTNSCRLMITDGRGNLLFRETIATRLGEGMYARMCFTPEAVERGVNALKTYAELLKKYKVSHYRAIATAACRMASNSMQFIEKVKQTSGLSLEVIDGRKEAELNLRGALLNAPKSAEYAVVFDIGGGSTEITMAAIKETPEIIYTISIPWGGRNASEAFNLAEENPENRQKLAAEISRYVAGFVEKSAFFQYRAKCCLIATSSTPLRLAALIKKPETYNRTDFDGIVLKKEEINQIMPAVFSMTLAERKASPYIGENRAAIFIPACTIFKTIYDSLGFETLIASLKSAQEGIIEEMVKAWQK